MKKVLVAQKISEEALKILRQFTEVKVVTEGDIDELKTTEQANGRLMPPDEKFKTKDKILTKEVYYWDTSSKIFILNE